MKVRMRVSVSGTRQGVDWPPAGSVIEVGDEEGMSLCAGGLADPVHDKDTGVEKAVAPKAEERGGLTTENVPTRSTRTKK